MKMDEATMAALEKIRDWAYDVMLEQKGSETEPQTEQEDEDSGIEEAAEAFVEDALAGGDKPKFTAIGKAEFLGSGKGEKPPPSSKAPVPRKGR